MINARGQQSRKWAPLGPVGASRWALPRRAPLALLRTELEGGVGHVYAETTDLSNMFKTNPSDGPTNTQVGKATANKSPSGTEDHCWPVPDGMPEPYDT